MAKFRYRLNMAKFTRRRLIAGAAPLVAAPVLGKLAFDGDAEAAQRTLQGHVHNHSDLGHAAMIGDSAPAPGGLQFRTFTSGRPFGASMVSAGTDPMYAR